MSHVSIGNRVLVSHGVNIIDNSGHSLDAQERAVHFGAIMSTGHPVLSAELPGIVTAPIHIEDDVWISFGVTILRGVRIGARSIVAAGAIVTKDIPPDTLYRCAFSPIMTSIKRS